MTNDSFIEHWVTRVEAVPPARFNPARDVNETLLALSFAGGDSMAWSARFFKPAASPLRPENAARLSIYAAAPGLPWATEGPRDPSRVWMDLLRYEYRFAGRDIVVYESVNFTLVHVVPRAMPGDGAGWARAVDEAAQELLNMTGPVRDEPGVAPYTWTFQFPPAIGEGTLISTNPGANPHLMGVWTLRLDVLVHAGAIWLMAYKKQMAMVGFAADGQWFADDFRSKQAP